MDEGGSLVSASCSYNIRDDLFLRLLARAARDAGASVRWWDVEGREGTLDPGRLDELLSPKTRMVAFGYASNLTGTVQPVADIARRARATAAACRA